MGVAENRINIREIRAIRFKKRISAISTLSAVKSKKNIVPLQSIFLELHIL